MVETPLCRGQQEHNEQALSQSSAPRVIARPTGSTISARQLGCWRAIGTLPSRVDATAREIAQVAQGCQVREAKEIGARNRCERAMRIRGAHGLGEAFYSK